MRRSAAPSRVGPLPFTERAPKADRVIINKTKQESIDSCIASHPATTIFGPKVFEVVYAKASSCKHKKWTNDGFAIIHGRTTRLVDDKGKYVASSSGNKAAYLNSLSEGSLLKVGGYESELIRLVSAEFYQAASGSVLEADRKASVLPHKDALREVHQNSTHHPSRANSSAGRSFLKPPRASTPSTFPKNDALVMPRPPAECVWVQNPEGFPIVDVVLEPQFARRLLPHQRDGVVFLYECVMGFRSGYSSVASSIPTILADPCSGEGAVGPVTGCILADEMGLGKTVQAIALLWLLLRQGPYGGSPVIRRCLLITPSALVQNWVNEISKWLGRERLPVYCVNQSMAIKDYINKSGNAPPVLIMSYEMFLSRAQEVHEIPQVDMVVCDEGHRLKNANISTYMAIQRLPARRRVLLTGTPVQNNMDELWSLAELCAPGRLSESQEAFRREFRLLPRSTSSHLVGAEDPEVNFSTTCQDKLSSLLSTFLLRRTTDVLRSSLTVKHEFVVFCRPSPLQTQLEHILYQWVQQELSKTSSPTRVPSGFSDSDSDDTAGPFEPSMTTESILCAIMAFRKLYNHPILLERFLRLQDGCKLPTSSRTRCNLPYELLEAMTPPDGVHRRIENADFENSASPLADSGKLAVLTHMLRQLFTQSAPNPLLKPRLVLVSNFTQTLDLLETICSQLLQRSPLRLDGKTPTKRRAEIVELLNEPRSDEHVLLLSSRAGGTGLNLVGANYLILFDMDWNPANDAQAMARIWRPGQLRPVRLYRLVTAGGLEERIFQRQAAKLALSHQALTNPTNAANFSSRQTLSKGVLTREELHDLFQTPPFRDSPCWTHTLIGCTCDASLSTSPSPTLSTVSNECSDPGAQRCSDDESDIRVCQLGQNPVASGPTKSHFTVPKEPRTSATDSLAFLLNWKHSLNDVVIRRLGDPLLSACEPCKENLPISAVFSLTTEEPETSQIPSPGVL